MIKSVVHHKYEKEAIEMANLKPGAPVMIAPKVAETVKDQEGHSCVFIRENGDYREYRCPVCGRGVAKQ